MTELQMLFVLPKHGVNGWPTGAREQPNMCGGVVRIEQAWVLVPVRTSGRLAVQRRRLDVNN